MANTFRIPFNNNFPWFQQRVTISDVVYTLTLRYNTRMGRWIMDIGDATDNPIHLGVPILIRRDLTGQYVVANIPPGAFYALDETNQGNQPGRYSIGITHQFFYWDPSATNTFGL